MTRKKADRKPEPPETRRGKLEDPQGRLKSIGGSESDSWNEILIHQTANALWLKDVTKESRDKHLNAVIAAMHGIGPRDEIEAMAAAQLLAAHNATMECYRRAMIPEQTFEGRQAALTQANKLSRTWTQLIEALNRHRGKDRQKVTVEHVHVHAGGQAIVGAVSHPRGGPQETEEQPRAQEPETDAGTPGALAHAPEPPMRSPDPEGDPLPIPRDAERPLSHARRKKLRCTQG